jgi:hypothetical protein
MELPDTGFSRYFMSRVFDYWIDDYESCSGDNDPASWFQNHQARIVEDLIATGFPAESLPDNIGTVISDYYEGE